MSKRYSLSPTMKLHPIASDSRIPFRRTSEKTTFSRSSQSTYLSSSASVIFFFCGKYRIKRIRLTCSRISAFECKGTTGNQWRFRCRRTSSSYTHRWRDSFSESAKVTPTRSTRFRSLVLRLLRRPTFCTRVPLMEPLELGTRVRAKRLGFLIRCFCVVLEMVKA